MNFDIQTRRQFAVYWEADGSDRTGEVKVKAPIQLEKIRWESGRRETIDPQATKVAYDATLFTSRVIKVGSILWEGKLADLPANPTENLFEALGTETSPSTKNDSNNRPVMLQRWKGRLPSFSS